MELGECFLINTPPKGKHIFVVTVLLSPGRYLFLPFTSQSQYSDPSCVIHPGKESPSFIGHETAIDYSKAKDLYEIKIIELIDSGQCLKRERIPEKLHRKILESGLKSKRLKRKYQKSIRSYLEANKK